MRRPQSNFRGASPGLALTESSSTTIHLILPRLWPISATRHGLRISMVSWDSPIYEVGEQVRTPQPASTRLAFQADMGFSQGKFIATNGQQHRGTFAFV